MLKISYINNIETKNCASTPEGVKRLIRSAAYSYEDQFFTSILSKTFSQTCEGLDRFINHLEKVDLITPKKRQKHLRFMNKSPFLDTLD